MAGSLLFVGAFERRGHLEDILRRSILDSAEAAQGPRQGCIEAPMGQNVFVANVKSHNPSENNIAQRISGLFRLDGDNTEEFTLQVGWGRRDAGRLYIYRRSFLQMRQLELVAAVGDGRGRPVDGISKIISRKIKNELASRTHVDESVFLLAIGGRVAGEKNYRWRGRYNRKMREWREIDPTVRGLRADPADRSRRNDSIEDAAVEIFCRSRINKHVLPCRRRVATKQRRNHPGSVEPTLIVTTNEIITDIGDHDGRLGRQDGLSVSCEKAQNPYR